MEYAAVTTALAGLGSDKWVLNAAAQRRKALGRQILNLTIGEPDVPTTRSLGRAIASDRFLCLPGTQTALYLVFRALCDPDCEVIVGDPMYATYEGLIRASGAVPVPVPLAPEHGFRLQPQAVRAAITPRTRAIFLNTPHNPTGAILRPGDLRALGALAAAHDLWIVSDEVYADLTHDQRAFTSALADPAFEDRTILAASISKSHAAPGFRSGWVVGPAAFCARALPLSETMLFGSQPFIADMTAQALGAPPSLARGMADRMANRARIIRDALDGVAGLKVSRPEAGMFALIDIRNLSNDSLQFALDLLEKTDVAVMPGASFGTALEGWMPKPVTPVPVSVLLLKARLHDASSHEECRANPCRLAEIHGGRCHVRHPRRAHDRTVSRVARVWHPSRHAAPRGGRGLHGRWLCAGFGAVRGGAGDYRARRDQHVDTDGAGTRRQCADAGHLGRQSARNAGARVGVSA